MISLGILSKWDPQGLSQSILCRLHRISSCITNINMLDPDPWAAEIMHLSIDFNALSIRPLVFNIYVKIQRSSSLYRWGNWDTGCLHNRNCCCSYCFNYGSHTTMVGLPSVNTVLAAATYCCSPKLLLQISEALLPELYPCWGFSISYRALLQNSLAKTDNQDRTVTRTEICILIPHSNHWNNLNFKRCYLLNFIFPMEQ